MPTARQPARSPVPVEPGNPLAGRDGERLPSPSQLPPEALADRARLVTRAVAAVVTTKVRVADISVHLMMHRRTSTILRYSGGQVVPLALQCRAQRPPRRPTHTPDLTWWRRPERPGWAGFDWWVAMPATRTPFASHRARPNRPSGLRGPLKIAQSFAVAAAHRGGLYASAQHFLIGRCCGVW